MREGEALLRFGFMSSLSHKLINKHTKGTIMSKLAYFTNLLYTIAFIYSLTKVADGSGYFWLGTLVISTIALSIIFLTHCYAVSEKE
jgi:hypothetical protein